MDDYVAMIITISCLGTLTNMSVNMETLEKTKVSQNDKLLDEILQQLKELNGKLA